MAEAFWANWFTYGHPSQIQRRIEAQVFDFLVRIESEDFTAYSPGLAESWTPIDDLTWEFKLRRGVTFHKGQDFTAADVKASIELATGAAGEEVVSASRFVPTTVEVVDEYTARLKTKTPFGPLLNELSYLPIISAIDAQAGIPALEAAPNGTGPFMVVNDEKDRKTMEAFAGHWGGAAQIKTLVWEFIQDSQTRLNALLAGQAHVIDRVPPEHLPVLEQSPDVAVISTTGFENVNLWFRQDAPPPWDNPKLREAVAWSVDRDALVKNLVLGASEVATTHIPNHAVFAAPQSPQYTFDPERAKAALAEAGFSGEGPEIDFWGVTGFLPRGKEVAEAIKANLEEVGFKVKLTVTDIGSLVSALFAEDKPGVMFHVSWSSSGDPHSALVFLYHSNPTSWTGAADAKIDELLDRGAATTNPDDRAAVYAELQAYLWQNLPHIPLYNSDFTIAHAKDLSGVKTLPNFFTYFNAASLSAS